MKSGNLNFLEPSGPLQACNGTALPFYSSDDPHVQCCSRGNRQTMVVRQNKGPVSLDRTRHMTFKWNVCKLYIDSCSTPWECVRATSVINHFESRFCQPDNPSCIIIPWIKTTPLYSLLTHQNNHLQFPDNVNHEDTLDMYIENNTCNDTFTTYEVQHYCPSTVRGSHPGTCTTPVGMWTQLTDIVKSENEQEEEEDRLGSPVVCDLYTVLLIDNFHPKTL